jgi:hypothetical protein
MRRLVGALDAYDDHVVGHIVALFDRERVRVQRAASLNAAAAAQTQTQTQTHPLSQATTPTNVDIKHEHSPAPPPPPPTATTINPILATEWVSVLNAVRAPPDATTRPLAANDIPRPQWNLAQHGRIMGAVETAENRAEWLLGVLEWAIHIVGTFVDERVSVCGVGDDDADKWATTTTTDHWISRRCRHDSGEVQGGHSAGYSGGKDLKGGKLSCAYRGPGCSIPEAMSTPPPPPPPPPLHTSRAYTPIRLYSD